MWDNGKDSSGLNEGDEETAEVDATWARVYCEPLLEDPRGESDDARTDVSRHQILATFGLFSL